MYRQGDESLGKFRLYPREFIASFIEPAIRRTFYLTVVLDGEASGDRASIRENRVLNKRTSWNAMKNMFLQARTIRVAILLYPPLTAAHRASSLLKSVETIVHLRDDSPRISRAANTANCSPRDIIETKGNNRFSKFNKFPDSLSVFSRITPQRISVEFSEGDKRHLARLLVHDRHKAAFRQLSLAASSQLHRLPFLTSVKTVTSRISCIFLLVRIDA